MRNSITVEQREKKSKKFLNDMHTIGMKPRNGMFSDPISLAVGDVHYVAPTRKYRNDGKVPTCPKSFYTSKLKNGQSDQALFSKPRYNCLNDPYDESWKSLQLRTSVSRSKSRQRPFTAGGRVKQKDPTSFLKNQLIEKENMREGAGNVKSRNPNFVTSNLQRGGGKTTPGVCIGGSTIKYSEDDYDREKDHKREESRKNKERILLPFSSRVKQRTTFTKDKHSYSVQGIALHPKKELYEYEGAKHSGPFKPSHPAKKGHNKTLEKFPTYVEDQGKKIQQKSLNHYAKQTSHWKHPTKHKSKVCDTITGNFRNHRQAYYSKFY